MEDKMDIIEIIIPSEIPDSIRKIDGISNTRKAEIHRKIKEGNAELQTRIMQNKIKKNPELEELNKKLSMIFEILEDRTAHELPFTLEEIIDTVHIESKDVSSFMLRLNSLAKNKGKRVKKSKSRGKTSYKLI